MNTGVGPHETDQPGVDNEKEHKLTLHFTVNGVREKWHHHHISYEHVVHLAFPTGGSGGDIRYNVTYTLPDGQEGALRPGHHVHVIEGMLFDVRNTDKS